MTEPAKELSPQKKGLTLSKPAQEALELSQQAEMLALIEEAGDLEMKLRNVLFRLAICLRACRKCVANGNNKEAGK